MSEVVVQKYEAEGKRRSEVPQTIDWHSAKMARRHSLIATVKEMINLSTSYDLVRVNIIGTPSTGKTTLGLTLAHLFHKYSKKTTGIDYVVKRFTKKDLLNFELTLSKLQPVNHVIIFDDISFLKAGVKGNNKIEEIEAAMTEIRHLPGGIDIRIVCIFNFHYNKSVPPYLRQAEFYYYTKIGTQEIKNTVDIIGQANQKQALTKVMDFINTEQEASGDKQFGFVLSKKGKRFIYKFKEPFVPALYCYRGQQRIVVFPKREWIDPICHICSNCYLEPIKTNMDVKKVDETARSRFGIGVIRQALRIMLFRMGVSTYPVRVKQCMAYFEIMFKDMEVMNPEQLADFYGLRDIKTRYRSRPGGDKIL